MILYETGPATIRELINVLRTGRPCIGNGSASYYQTSSRFNEQSELSQRYIKFNLQQLVNSAVNASHGARHCTRILKCSEGLHNKAFILTMDNGSEVFTKLPNPNAGPIPFTTASEVATPEDYT